MWVLIVFAVTVDGVSMKDVGPFTDERLCAEAAVAVQGVYTRDRQEPNEVGRRLTVYARCVKKNR